MKIFVIGGKARSGKNTLGDYLKEELEEKGYKPCLMHITEPLYSYARNYFGYTANKDEKPREFLQQMGIEVIQNKLGKKDFLINRLFEDIEILKNFFDTFIITDARLIKELEEIKKKYENTTAIKLERNNNVSDLTTKEQQHITETEIDTYNDFDYIIKNNSKEDLIQAAKLIIREKIEEEQ